MALPSVPDAFFRRPTVQVAKSLLGAFLVHQSPEGLTAGRIVETEAYLRDDPACHASRGQTPRTRVMFGPPGHAYIYFIYGMYYCFNVVTAKEGVGEAVLIRALEPVTGIGLMQERRSKKNQKIHSIKELCNGPAKLVIAMGIPTALNGAPLQVGSLWIAPPDSKAGPSPARPKPSIHVTTRIGITQGAELPLRFYLKNNPYISKK